MKFGVFYEIQLPTPWQEGDQQRMFRETLEHVQLADRLGIDEAFMIGADGRPIHSGQLAVLVDGDTVRLEADATQDSRTENLEVFLIGGVPLGEPVVQYGPFVMNTDAQIREAFEDYQQGRLGRVPAGAIQPHRVRR